MTGTRHSSLRFVAFVAVVFGAAAWAGIVLTQELGRVAAIWFSNAFLVSALLLSQRSLWPWLIGATYAVNVTVNWLIGDSIAASLGFSLANTLESTIAAWPLRRSLRSSIDLLNPQVLTRFFLYAVLLAPAISATLGSLVLLIAAGNIFADSFIRWWAADALGMAIVVPLVLAIRPSEIIESIRSQHPFDVFGAFSLLAVVATLVFSQNTYPILFLLLPPLVLIAFRFGFEGTAIAISLCAALAFAFTIAGYGPFMLVQEGNAVSRIMVLQLLLATLIVTTYPVCAVTSGQRRLLAEVAASEERFRILAANSSDIIALTDNDGIWRYLSPAVTTITGWKAEELVGRDGMPFVHIEDAALYMRGTELLMQGREMLAGSFRMRHRDGHYVWVETISRSLFDKRGKQLGWVSSTRDISARKRIDQIKSEFISTVNHELRTPLTAMLGAVGLAATGKFGTVSDELQKLLNMAKSNGDRLATLVNDILDFEKVSSGKMQFDLQPYSVDALVEQSIAAIRPYAAQLSITIVRGRLAPHATIKVDESRFQQVMANLLSNAAKFSAPGSSVEVDVEATNERCRISVIDHGCGIPPEFRASLFDRFAQADGSDRRKRGGTGLGMAIAKHMTEQMSGSIDFESAENVGTTFRIEFPLAQKVAAA